jgi:hypothetical protein
MRVADITSEQIYDENVSPSVVQLTALCQASNIPLIICSTFSRDDEEGSVSTCVGMANASLRMKHISAFAANAGRVTAGLNAKLMLGDDSGFDANWAVKNPKNWTEIENLINAIATLVDVTYKFPTALIVQTPTKGTYIIRGSYPSDAYQGIQYMRVIAEHGYSQQAMRELMGDSGGAESDAILRTFSMMRQLTAIKPTIGKRKLKK